MLERLLIATSILVAGSILPNAVHAQEGADDAAVWQVITEQWQRNRDGDSDWLDELLTDDFTGWPTDAPAPRSKGSTKTWHRFNEKLWDSKHFELHPLEIVIHGDTAVAHYLYSNGGEDQDGNTVIVSGRYTDVLVRTEDGWKFVAWHGGGDD